MKRNIDPVKLQLQILEDKFITQTSRLQKAKEIIQAALEVTGEVSLPDEEIILFYKDMLNLANAVLESN